MPIKFLSKLIKDLTISNCPSVASHMWYFSVRFFFDIWWVDKNFIGIIHDFRFVYTSCALRWSYLFRREMPLVFLMASCAAHLFSFQKLLGLTLKCGIFTAFTCCLGQWTETIVLLALLPYAYSILSRLLRLLEFQ